MEANSNPKAHVDSSGRVVPHMNGRAYFANECRPGVYDHTQYLAFNLLGKTVRYTTDISGLACGCNAAFYLTSMRRNSHASQCSDYYCDANNVCGESCAEIDLQEANMHSWHSTLHTRTDHSGLGAGYGGGGAGWSGPRDWTSAEYGPGARCIDTSRPFDVAVSFPADAGCQLTGMQVTLSQKGHDCPLSVNIGNYNGMSELSAALGAGMTPIVSYWSAADMLWMDGQGQDMKGACAVDTPGACASATVFSDFSIEAIRGSPCNAKLTDQLPAQPLRPKPKEPESNVSTTNPESNVSTTNPTNHPQQTSLSPMWPGAVASGAIGFLAGISVAFVALRLCQASATVEQAGSSRLPFSHGSPRAGALLEMSPGNGHTA